MQMPRMVLILLSISTLFFNACSSLQPEKSLKNKCLIQEQKKPTQNLQSYFKKTDKPLAGHSALYPLALPQDALAARLFLIDHAQKTLDVQYYIYENDTIGSLVAYHLVQAAQRGVKVRILLDDISTTGKDKEITTLAQHPNISLKLFNPNSLRTLFRNIALLLDVNTLGKRMHNKALIADNTAAIIGGRNIGDVYYASNNKTLFLDYDALIIGAVIPDISQSFNIYWNAKESVSYEKVLDEENRLTFDEAQKIICNRVSEFEKSRAGQIVATAPFNLAIKNNSLLFTVAEETHLFYDLPSKVSTNENDDTYHISKQISEDLKEVEHELIIISPYFIPSQTLLQRLKKLREKGVNIIVVTNSLASTDVFPVYGGYISYIEPLVKMGVHLYELKPTVLQNIAKKKKIKNPPALSLHTKLIFSDNERMAIGSANIDPRSEKLNTELLMLVTSKKLASQEEEYVKSILTLENFYKLSWGEQPKGPYDDGITYYGPIWKTLENGKEKFYYSPPQASFWKRFGAGIVRLLPIEGYL